MKSIIQKNDKECFICGCNSNLETHHVMNKYNRDKAEKQGLKVKLCINHHRGVYSPHMDRTVDLYLKEEAQRCWMQYYNKTKEDFIQEFGRNYL